MQEFKPKMPIGDQLFRKSRRTLLTVFLAFGIPHLIGTLAIAEPLPSVQQSPGASPVVVQALKVLQEFYSVQADPASASKSTADFTKALEAITRSFSQDVQRDKHVALVIAVMKADRGINVVREVRAITNREPGFWLGWRCLVTTSLLFEDQRKAMTTLLNYHKKILTIFVERDAEADNQDLAREIFWVRDACQQMGNLEDASERWVESIMKHDEAERMLAQIANVAAIQQQLAEDRERKDNELAILNKDPEQAKRAISIILGRVDPSMTALQDAYRNANASLPTIQRAYESSRKNLSTAISNRERAEAALRSVPKANAGQMSAVTAARAVASQAERQVRDASRLYSKQLGIMQTAVVRMAAVSRNASESLAEAKTKYQEALAADKSAQAAAADAERRIAAHISSVPKVPTTWVDKSAKSQEVAATLQISIEEIFEDAQGITEAG